MDTKTTNVDTIDKIQTDLQTQSWIGLLLKMVCLSFVARLKLKEEVKSGENSQVEWIEERRCSTGQLLALHYS